MSDGDLGTARMTPEGIVPTRDLAPPIRLTWTLENYAGEPVHKNGYIYWTMPDMGIVRAPNHRFEQYEVAVPLNEVPTTLAMDVPNGFIYWRTSPPGDSPRVPLHEKILGHLVGVLVDQGFKTKTLESFCAGPSTEFEGLSFAPLEANQVAVFSLWQGLEWVNRIGPSGNSLVGSLHAVSTARRRVVLLNDTYRLYVWDLDTGERKLRVSLSQLGLAPLLQHDHGECHPLRGDLVIDEDLVIVSCLQPLIFALDINSGRLKWAMDVGATVLSALVTDQGRVLIAATDPVLDQITALARDDNDRLLVSQRLGVRTCHHERLDYIELDARTGAPLATFRGCHDPAGDGAPALAGAEPDSVNADATRTHCYLAGPNGTCYAINRQTGAMDGWWQDTDWHEEPFTAVVWDRALFLYGVDARGFARMNVLEPAS